MMVVFSPIFVADTRLIFVYDFKACFQNKNRLSPTISGSLKKLTAILHHRFYLLNT